MKKIAVIGAGGWGLALGLLLHEKNNKVIFWCYDEYEKNDILQHRENKRCLPGIKIPIEVQFTCDMKEALDEADIAILAVPSKAIRSTAKAMKKIILEKTIIVNVSKGIEDGSLLCLADVIKEELSNPVVVLSGPSHAEEVARHIPTAVTVSSLHMNKAYEIQELFMNQYFRVYTNDDLIGVELGGALKNVIALAAGIVEGMGYGDNTKAALITRGIAEITRLGIAMGGKQATFSGLTGIGDLVVTCTSGHSRNRRAGELVGQGLTIEEAMKQVNMVVEGVPTTKAAYNLMKKYQVEMPILNAIYCVLFEKQPVKETIDGLMMRNKKDEQGL
ncbi:MAG: NAD(P)H-dependent glycerol-3-phosphate dehydrogenase [Cellulosilyticum sp.]|nr:NAD(P)H-dependent glycerol-3-phosphate dehydrogenase [Cellulosilyticum sp.]MEE1070830.1 NAD(P)H-dependent glycerol-3-phosphate dehydrogenase [Cellulosilyticum sp.]